jgi:hypothetical protein
MSYPTLHYKNSLFYHLQLPHGSIALSGDNRKTEIGRNCRIRIFDCYSSSTCNNSKFLSFYVAYFSI